MWTGSDGVAVFSTDGRTGNVSPCTILNIVLSLHTFDPDHSVLSGSTTMGR